MEERRERYQPGRKGEGEMEFILLTSSLSVQMDR
jgi:hypothetical protein